MNKIIKFLLELSENNNKTWFLENKQKYQHSKADFEILVNDLILKIQEFDKSVEFCSVKDSVFRIFRDARFSKNKSPYKTNFWAFISNWWRKSKYAWYYIHIEPSKSFVGWWIYMPDFDILYKIRNGIYKNTNEFKEIINNSDFQKYFKELYWEKLKNAPRDFEKTFADIELLKYKHYVVAHNLDDSFWDRKDIIDYLTKVFKSQYEFNKFLNNILIAF